MSLFQQSDKSRNTLYDIRQRKAEVKRKIKITEREIKATKDDVLSPRAMVMDMFSQFDIRNLGKYVSVARQAYNFTSGIVSKIKQKYGQNSGD